MVGRVDQSELYRGFEPNYVFDFDPHIDIPALKDLYLPTTVGLAKASWSVAQVGSGHARTGRKDLFQEDENLARLPEDDPIKRATAGLNFRQRRTFLALHTECLTLGFSVPLRTQADFFKSKPDDPFSILNVRDTGNAQYFPDLLSFVDGLDIFEATGRVNIFITPPNAGGEIHRDYHRDRPGPRQLPHFVWFRCRLTKPFFLFEFEKGIKRYVSSHACWFNSNQFHGSDPVDFFTYSIRVDGKFRDSIARQVGFK